MAVVFERSPVPADSSIVGYDGLEYAVIVVGIILVLGREHDVTRLITDKIFIVGRNQ